ncbi:hypothetical protein AAG570_007994 [Ranatra chinensis]|uniref:VTT domain-containing protein n=1 Tax=Ranatra chinensis TaxID=642074 RepID=A0ABD0XTG6_9HEMI
MKIYYDQNWIYVVTLFCSAYLFKQAFVIPGSALLNILGGALFGITVALPLCCFLTCVGATCSYLISKFFCKELIKRKWPGNVNYLQIKVNENKNRLLYFLLFLRLFPMTPNWLINLVSPIVGIPLHLFTISVFIGLIPYNFLCVQAGSMLSSFSSLDDIFTYKTFMQLFIMALVALGPTLFLKGRVK